jgi:long-chain acyl-CoA synthetase
LEIANRASSVGRMFFDRVDETPNGEAYRFPSPDEHWTSETWQETADHVRRWAAGLIALGIEPQERVAIASGTRYEWILADLAVMSAGAATTTVYPSTVTEDVAYILGDSGSRVVFAEDDVQIGKLRERRADLPNVVKIVTFDGTADEPTGDAESSDDAWVIEIDRFEQLGQSLLDEQPDIIEQRIEAIEPSDLATLIYTSGTTGRPKGVLIPHSAWTYEGTAVEATDILHHDDLQYLWLPLAHSFGKVLLTAQLAVGFPTAIDGRVDKIIDNLAIVKPTFMGTAPRIFEKAHARIVTMTAKEGRLKKAIFDWAFKVALAADAKALAGQSVQPHLALQRRLADKLVMSKIRGRFGGRLRFMVSGSAALNQDIARWFHAAGLVILEGYGLTESSAGTFLNRPGNYQFGTVGHPFDGTEVKIADDGEILIKGPGVMDGYHGRPDATAESLVDGWLHTGDIGEIDDDGFVRITDRKKDLFKTSNGKYVAPSAIESMFKAVCPYVSQIVVHGHSRNFVSALIALDPESLQGWAADNGMSGKPYEEIVASDAAKTMVQSYVKELNERLNRWETIKRFVLLPRDLSIDEGEITPSLKVKRNVVEGHFRSELDALYTS